MTVSLRERVLAEAFARLQTLSGQGAGSVHRLAFAKIPEAELPAVVLVDGAETRPAPQQQSDAGTPDFDMRIGVLVVVRGQQDADVAPLLTAWRALVIAALAADRTTGLPETSFGGLLQWLTIVQSEPPSATSEQEASLPQAAQLHLFSAARPEAEMNAFLQSGF